MLNIETALGNSNGLEPKMKEPILCPLGTSDNESYPEVMSHTFLASIPAFSSSLYPNLSLVTIALFVLVGSVLF